MVSLKRFILLVVVLLSSSALLRASHLMGGEITWRCLGSGDFVFQMKLYRDCNGNPGPPSAALDVFNHPTLTNIPLTLVSQSDISPVCNVGGPNITCAGANGNTPGAVEEFIYESAPITIVGTPPAAGWIFTYTNCCRNSAITNLNNPGAAGFTLRAKMFAYNNLNTSPCYDNSPEFLESPRSIICTGTPFTYNHNAVDAELDSLAYAWAEPYDQMAAGTFNPPVNPPPVGFAPTFSFLSPLPGPALDPNNIPATINPATGEISYTSFTAGSFVTCIKVEAWKCGQLVAEIYREIQVVLLPCPGNQPPVVTPPFLDPNTNTYIRYADTVYAGQSVAFTLSATDFGLLGNGNPQTLTMDATGNQFGAGFINPNAGCLNPPCATLNPALPLSAPFGVATDFFWQTSCNHVSYQNQCFNLYNTYNFVIRTQDDFCPAPAINIATISITVLPLSMVPSPFLHCLAVQPNGDVQLTWDLQPDTGGTFNSYHIFAASNVNGPYTQIDSVFNYNQLSYTHVGANANAAPVYYYVQTRSGCAGAVYLPAQDTLSTIFLTVANPANGTALLNWNAMSTPPPGSQFAHYRIYREYPANNWVLLDSTLGLNYIDTITVCNATINYRIEIGDTLGCVSVSNVAGGQFQDIIAPSIPVLDTVSVDANGNAVLGWQMSASGDVEGYVIYQFINGIWTAIDTAWGIGTTTYINSISNADQQSELYIISAIDSCGNVSVACPPQRSLFVTRTINICAATVDLAWNSYINMMPGLGGYNVYASINSGPWTLIGSTPANDTTFTHTGLIQFATYCYYIEAYNIPDTMTARSEIVCVFSNVPQAPAFEYLRVATVAAENVVEVRAYVDAAASISRYDIYRADSITGAWLLIGNVPASAASQVVYTDLTAETNVQSYYYKMVAVDSCGADAFTSNIGRTIWLSGVAMENQTNVITWNDYELWLGGVSGYTIYRSVDEGPRVAVATVPYIGSGTNTYTDNVVNFLPDIGRFRYIIEAEEGLGNPYLYTDTSRSNEILVIQDPIVYAPNAFTPNNNGLNDVWMPTTAFVDIVDYDLSVYNRWGEQLFHTTDRTEGWDGHYKGKRIEGGVYVWILTFKTASGQYIDRKGTVTIYR